MPLTGTGVRILVEQKVKKTPRGVFPTQLATGFAPLLLAVPSDFFSCSLALEMDIRCWEYFLGLYGSFLGLAVSWRFAEESELGR